MNIYFSLAFEILGSQWGKEGFPPLPSVLEGQGWYKEGALTTLIN